MLNDEQDIKNILTSSSCTGENIALNLIDFSIEVFRSVKQFSKRMNFYSNWVSSCLKFKDIAYQGYLFYKKEDFDILNKNNREIDRVKSIFTERITLIDSSSSIYYNGYTFSNKIGEKAIVIGQVDQIYFKKANIRYVIKFDNNVIKACRDSAIREGNIKSQIMKRSPLILIDGCEEPTCKTKLYCKEIDLLSLAKGDTND